MIITGMENHLQKSRLKLKLKNVELIYFRDGYGKGLLELGEQNKNVVALCCDLIDSTRTKWFADKFPERFVEVGVAEQNMAGLGAGLAMAGKISFVSSYAIFSPGLNWAQIRLHIAYGNTNVKIMGAHAGISVGPDGATHQALEDVALTRVLPNMVVIAPCDYEECRKAIIATGKYIGPVYVRFGREKVPLITTLKTPFEIGKAEIFRDGSDVAVIACGSLVYEALVAAEELDKKGISVCVVNCHTIKPIDKKTLIKVAKKCKKIVTAEEHQVIGGLGSAVAEVLSSEFPVYIKMIGVKDRFGESGEPKELMEKYRLTSKEIIKEINNLLK